METEMRRDGQTQDRGREMKRVNSQTFVSVCSSHCAGPSPLLGRAQRRSRPAGRPRTHSCEGRPRVSGSVRTATGSAGATRHTCAATPQRNRRHRPPTATAHLRKVDR